MNRATARLLLTLMPLSLAACSSTGDYPSLAPRAGERVAGCARPVPGAEQAEAPPLPPPSADLVTRLGGLVSAAQEADRRFQAQQKEAASMVARAEGHPATSDQWASAHIALGKLETSRSAAVAALAELDGLYADARGSAPVELSPAAEAIAEARARVSDLVARENAALADLSAQLAS